MGFFKVAGKLAWGATKITTKVATKTVGVAAGLIYDNKETIAAAAVGTAKIAAKTTIATASVAYKATAATAKVINNHRDEIGGAIVGVAKGTVKVAQDATGHFISQDSINSKIHQIEEQSRRYRGLTNQIKNKTGYSSNKRTLLDTLVVGGETIASYVSSGKIPLDVQKAYELAYPNVASARSFVDEAGRLNGQELVGFVSGVKGKLFEINYVDYLNDGNLPVGYSAALAGSPTNPGWDIAIIGPDGAIKDTIQAKATDSVAYVSEAIEKYPQIDVVTTSEVHSHLVMQGFSDNVIDSAISDADITSIVEGSLDGATTTMHWMPSAVSLALIAFSSYNNEGLSAYQESKQFGERASKSYLSYLAGGALSIATGTWWIGVLGGMGSRLLLGAGRQKYERMSQLQQTIKNNDAVLKRLQVRAV